MLIPDNDAGVKIYLTALAVSHFLLLSFGFPVFLLFVILDSKVESDKMLFLAGIFS